MRETVYDLAPSRRSARVFAGVALGAVAFAANSAYEKAYGVVVYALAFGALCGGWAVVKALTEPYRILLFDDGLVFRARKRRIIVAWADLARVTLTYSRFGTRLIWQTVDGGGLTTPAFKNVHRLLTDIEQRASHVEVRAWPFPSLIGATTRPDNLRSRRGLAGAW